MIILAIYKKNGTITHFQYLEKMPKDPAKAIEDFNKRYFEEGKTVSIEEFADDSLVAFLYKSQQGRKREFKNDLADIYNLADSLTDKLRWLEGEFEKMED